jgi:uncharacterized protein YlzI (FlbEa/FlbD family)
MVEEIVRPQEGFQMEFLSSTADIVIGGSAAGVGKTFALLLEPLHYIEKVKGFGGVIFRRTTPQIMNEGGLWDTSMEIFPHVGASPRESKHDWVFSYGNKLKFAHLEYEKDKLSWQGSQIPFIGFDELTHFTETQFFYILSRNRSACGIKPYVRATCNPDPDSWVAKLIEWWIDPDTGFPIRDREGVLRYFVKSGNQYIWGDSYEEVKEKAWHFLEKIIEKSGLDAENFIKSITFISGSVYDNKKLLEKDPSYIANLLNQDDDVKSQLFDGNWKHIPNNLDIYEFEAFRDMFNSQIRVTGEKGITADIALEGSNKFVIGYWEGKHLEDIEIVQKSKGNEVIEKINNMARKYGVSNRNITFDGDGVGGFVDGFIQGSVSFNGGNSPIEVKDNATGKMIKENYFNLKTQCFYRSGKAVSNNEYSVSEKVKNTLYDGKITVYEQMMKERKAIKKDKIDTDGKRRIISKQEMKVILGGESPDIMDMFMMREYSFLKPQFNLWDFA